MSDPLRPYRQLARNNLLANRRLQIAVAGLQQREWQAPRDSFFPSLHATMNHIYCVDRFYIDALQGGTLGVAAFADPEPFLDAQDLAVAQTALDNSVLTTVLSLKPVDLDRPVYIHRAQRIQVDALSDTLMHLFLHSQHHRGQVHAMLSATSIKPPQLDEFFMADDARFRADDLAALHWTETDLMS
jgi:uncharacterized damage-inducible protein DinB